MKAWIRAIILTITAILFWFIEIVINPSDFELILVDDGSTDLSGVICDEYASEDKRVHVIHKENTGVSDSRNLALDAAQGTYLQFLDAE